MNQISSGSELALNRADLLVWAASSLAFYGLDCTKLGTILIAQLRQIELDRTFSIFNVTDEIKFLEGLGPKLPTAPPGPFNHPPLQGFQKKHFTTPRFLAKNLLNYAQSKAGKKHHARAWADAVAKSQDDIVNEDFIAHYASETTLGSFSAKAQQESLTGEWIVFKSIEGGNYYFTLAGHEESNQAIFERIKVCAQFDDIILDVARGV